MPEGENQLLLGNGVVIRPVKRSDVHHFAKWFSDQEVMQYLQEYLLTTEMAEEKVIEDAGTTYAKTDALMVIEAVEGDSTTPIGTIALHRINPKDRCAHFGIAVGEKDYWSRGCGTEATRLMVNYGFEQLGLHRISSGVFSFNERSLRMHRRVGFIEEGRQRELDLKNGRYHDRIMFGILRREWSAQVGR